MKFNKLILGSFILLILVFSITAISAADLNDTDDTNVLKDENMNANSFSDLNRGINDAESNIDLGNDYKYNNTKDQDHVKGINIIKDNFVINGNNHVIDCDNKARAFNIIGNNVEIKNLIIKNAFYEQGSAISTVSALTLNNVTFINCSGNGTESTNLGAIQAQEKLIVNNCRFFNTSGYEGASITAYSTDVTITNSTFISSSDKIFKGHIYAYESNIIIENSDFLNTTSKYATAIFCEGAGKLDISNSRFKNLHANKTAGAIATKLIDSLGINNCEFDNISSENNGGAIFIDSNGNKQKEISVVLATTRFNDCYSSFGGALLQLGGNLILSFANFTSNMAEYEGGAVYTSYAQVQIYETNFKSNTLKDELSYGGACYFDKGDVFIGKNTFENNLGVNVSTIFAYDTNLTLQNNYFNNPSNATSIYTVYGKVSFNENNFTNDKLSLNNKNNNYNFEGVTNPFTVISSPSSVGEIPKTFDLRDYGWVSPVKNQGFMGACWMFGSLGALESALMRYANVTYSLSVNNAQNSILKYSKYGTVNTVEGGSVFGAMAYLIDWLGVFPEEYDGYDELGKISSLFITPDNIHIENAVCVPARKNALDNNLIKEALMKYGVLSVSHRADFDESKYYNQAHAAQYYTGTINEGTHRVCVVGWNDTYSRDNFLTKPAGDGAWICKNSWGTDWGDKGYFYISYYDLSFASDESVTYIITNDTYNRIYQNDVGGQIAKYNVNCYRSNFIADEDELIAAVGTYFSNEGDNYQFTIYVNGVEVHSQQGKSSFGGYETIKLNKYVQVKKGDKFTVQFKNRLFVATSLRINIQNGQSEYSTDNGKTWVDLAKAGDVAILKAYTISDLKITESLVKYYSNETPFVAKVNPGEEVVFQFNGKTYPVKADENGTAKLEINCNVGNYSITTTYNNISIVNYIMIKTTVVSNDVERTQNSNYDHKIQLFDSAGKPLKNTKVAVSINGKSNSYTSDGSGYITIKFTKLNQGYMTIAVTNPVTGEVKKSKISVYSRFSGAKNIAMYYYDGTKVKMGILGDDATFVGANQIVTIKLNKKTYKVKTDAKGFITFKIPNTVKPGTYELTAIYKGEIDKRTVKVKQNLKIKKYTVKKSAKKLVIKATLKNGKKALKNKKITLKLNGKKFTAKTNKKGIAKFTIKKKFIKKLKKGKKYTMKVTYLKNTIKTTLKVKR